MSENPYLPRPVEILHVKRQTALDSTFRLAWPQRPQPGQFFELSIPGLGEAPISVSDFGEGYIELTIRKVGQLTEGIHRLRAGDRLFLRGPYGVGFPLERYVNRHLIIAAGGTGLAAVKSIINYFLARSGSLKGLDILLGFKSPKDVLFGDEIKGWSKRARVSLTVDNPLEEGWHGQVGVITTLIPEMEIPDPGEVEAIVVGPPLMMKYSVQAFVEKGVGKAHIWASYERRMSCGIGKCGHCKINHAYVCLDGPVFNFAVAQWLLD